MFGDLFKSLLPECFRPFTWCRPYGGQGCLTTPPKLPKRYILPKLFFDSIGPQITVLVIGSIILFIIEFCLRHSGIDLGTSISKGIVIVCAAIVCILITRILFDKRINLCRSIFIDSHRHSVVHHIRNEHFECLDNLARLCGHSEQEELDRAIVTYGNHVCTKVATLFKSILNDDGIECALRIAHLDDTGEVYYSTFGRSERLRRRSATSEPIHADTGLPKKLSEASEKIAKGADREGNILIIRDVLSEKIEEFWEKGLNDNDNDLCSLVALPINSWGITPEDSPQMFGILYITSNLKNFRCPFSPNVIADQAAFVADALAYSLQDIMDTRDSCYET